MPAEPLAREVALDPVSLRAAQDELTAFLGGMGVPDIVVLRTTLVVEEWAANLMHHGRFAGPAVPMRLRAEVTDGAVLLVLEDSAAPFDPRGAAAPPPPVLEQDFRGGLGLALIGQLAQITGYGPAGDGWNRLELAVPRG